MGAEGTPPRHEPQPTSRAKHNERVPQNCSSLSKTEYNELEHLESQEKCASNYDSSASRVNFAWEPVDENKTD